MDLKTEINGIIRDIEGINIEEADVGCDDEHYRICLNNLGNAADYLYGVIFYLENHE